MGLAIAAAVVICAIIHCVAGVIALGWWQEHKEKREEKAIHEHVAMRQREGPLVLMASKGDVVLRHRHHGEQHIKRRRS